MKSIRYSKELNFPLLAASFLVANTVCIADSNIISFESEIRCCFTQQETRENFSIVLVNYNASKSHLTVITPENRVLGFLKKQNKYTVPDKEHIYATEPQSRAPIHVPEYHKGRNYIFQLLKLYKGVYTVEVHGLKTGNYFLSFYPGGLGNSRGVQHVSNSGSGGVHIIKDEIHRYEFHGKFDNILDGSIPLDSPTRFKVTRVK